MAAHGEPGVGLDARLGVIDHAVANLGDAAAGLTADVLVVTVLLLVPRDPVAQVEALDDPSVLERDDRAKDRGVVGAGDVPADRIEKLHERPGVALFGREQPADLVADRARSRHGPIVANHLRI